MVAHHACRPHARLPLTTPTAVLYHRAQLCVSKLCMDGTVDSAEQAPVCKDGVQTFTSLCHAYCSDTGAAFKGLSDADKQAALGSLSGITHGACKKTTCPTQREVGGHGRCPCLCNMYPNTRVDSS